MHVPVRANWTMLVLLCLGLATTTSCSNWREGPEQTLNDACEIQAKSWARDAQQAHGYCNCVTQYIKEKGGTDTVFERIEVAISDSVHQKCGGL
jgi:hypothetical protein